jgi:hypothetical protein
MLASFRTGSALAALALMTSLAASQVREAPPAEPLKVLGTLPIREVTVFKDGHAYVVHEGSKPVNAAGDVVIDELPQPVLGTFWPYVTRGGRLAAVTAGRRRVLVERTALDVRSLLEANPGAEVILVDDFGRHPGIVVGIPSRSSDELARTEPPGGGELLPQKSNLVLVKTAEGVRAAPLDRIREITLRGDYKKTVAGEEFRNVLTLDLDWGGGTPTETANVGMGYLQKGLRWIPSYQVTPGASGVASVRLEATLVNDLADLEDVAVNLVIGVPTFDFAGIVDPISLQAALAPVATQLDRAQGYYANAIMSQVVSYAAEGGPRDAVAGAPAEPELAGGAQNEDLYVFTVRKVSLRKGERMVVPVLETTLPFKDVYTLDYDFGPPPEVRANVDTARQEELARKLGEVKVVHKLRITNDANEPLTTAPALIIRDGKVLAQSTMTYTSPRGEVDLPVTAAVDVKPKRTDKETDRTPNATEWRGSSFHRVTLAGAIEIRNYKDKAVTIEVSRQVLGTMDGATPEGAVTQKSLEEFWSTTGRPRWWWHWYGWPAWWPALNGVGEARWIVTIEPGKTAALAYTWHYFGG